MTVSIVPMSSDELAQEISRLEEEPSQSDQMATLALLLSQKLGGTRVEAMVTAMEWFSRSLDTWPGMANFDYTGSGEKKIPFAARGLDTPEGDDYPEPISVVQAAQELAEVGFTLDDLIDAVGPDWVPNPRGYKNHLANLLRAHGFFSRQLRRAGKRQLLWFHPDATE